jgi:hypothetical protein
MNMIGEEKKLTRQIILLMIGLIAIFTGILALNFSDDDIVWMFYPSTIVGILFGIATCIYLSEAWDPENLTMKQPSTRAIKSRISWHWGAPLGVLAGNIAAQFLGNEIRNLFMGLFYGWFYLVTIYMIVQVWRHRPK